jgi:hypothetical protein
MSAMRFFVAALRHCVLTTCSALFDLGRLFLLVLRLRAALAAENLFLRKQLALFQERKVKPRHAEDYGDRELAVRLADGARSRQT